MNSSSRILFDFFSPLFFPLISLIISITLCFNIFQQKIALEWYYLFLFSLVTGIIYTKNSRFSQSAIVCFVIAIGGWARTTQINSRAIHFPFNIPHTSLEGTLVNTSIAPKSPLRHCYTIDLTMINQHTVPLPYTIQLYTSYPLDAAIDDTIALYNITLKKATNNNFNTYLLKEGIIATVFAKQVNYTITKKPCSLRRWLFMQRDRILHNFKKSLSPSTFALFSSLFLGKKETSNTIHTVQKQFKQWGILHYLARSGLHLVIVLSLYELLFRLLPVPFVMKHLILLLLNIMYFLLSWSSISFIRAFLIFVFYKLFSLFYVPVHFLHILYLTCIIILLINPLQLFFLDFQLSFGFTFALGWLNQYKVDQKA